MATVAASGDGNAPSTAANKKNNGATIVKAGSASTTEGPITNSISVHELADDVHEVIGSKVLVKSGTGASTTDRAGIQQPYPSAGLAFQQTATTWVMRGGNVTQTLAGSGNTVLVSAGADYDGNATARDNIHQNLQTQMVGSGNGTFDLYAVPSTEITPNYTKGGDAGSTRLFVAPSGAGDVDAVDNAADTSRAVPGELTYRDGSADPVTDEYKSKATYEL